MRNIRINKQDQEILIAILESAPGGLDIGEVRKALRVIEKIESASGLLVLEDAEYEYLLGRFRQTRFVKVTKELVELADRLDGAANIGAGD